MSVVDEALRALQQKIDGVPPPTTTLASAPDLKPSWPLRSLDVT